MKAYHILRCYNLMLGTATRRSGGLWYGSCINLDLSLDLGFDPNTDSCTAKRMESTGLQYFTH